MHEEQLPNDITNPHILLKKRNASVSAPFFMETYKITILGDKYPPLC